MRTCDSSEVRGQHGGSTGPWVCGGGRGQGTEKAESDPQEDALSSQTRRGRFRCRPTGRAQSEESPETTDHRKLVLQIKGGPRLLTTVFRAAPSASGPLLQVWKRPDGTRCAEGPSQWHPTSQNHPGPGKAAPPGGSCPLGSTRSRWSLQGKDFL